MFKSGNPVHLTLVKIQYHYSIACPWKHGWIRSISVVMANVINIITISWQPLYANLAPLSIWYFSKRRHSNARPRKHGYRHQNYISKYTRNEDMLNWSKWHIFSKKNVENDFFQKMEKNILFYSRVEPRFKIFYSYVYKKQSYIELIEMAHLPKKNCRKWLFPKNGKK